MVNIDASTPTIEIACDIPGCPFAEHISTDMLTTMHAREATKHSRRVVAIGIAETRGWFFETLRSKRGMILLRDVCPRHAPGYRTLSAKSGRGVQLWTY